MDEKREKERVGEAGREEGRFVAVVKSSDASETSAPRPCEKRETRTYFFLSSDSARKNRLSPAKRYPYNKTLYAIRLTLTIRALYAFLRTSTILLRIILTPRPK